MNKYLKIISFSALFFLSSVGLKAQSGNVGIGTNSPDASAILHLDFTLPTNVPRGFLAPRMLRSGRDSIINPANGLLIYQTDNNPGFYFNAGTSGVPNWVRVLENGTGQYLPLSGGIMSGSINGLTGLTSSGTITFSGLTQNQFVKTLAGGQLSTDTLKQADLPLTNGYLYIGNGSGRASEYAISGGASISANGVLVLNADSVINKGLNGFALGANSTILDSDNILGAFGKTQSQINNINSSISAIHPAVSINATANGLSVVPTTQVLSLGLASSANTGALSSADWTIFNRKQDTLTQADIKTTTTGLSISGSGKVVGSDINLNIQTANSTQPGLLSAADYAKFNSKQDTLTQGSLNTTTTGVAISGTGKVLGSNINLNIQTANSTQPGLLSAADYAKFNSKQDTLTQGSLNTTTTGVSIGGSGKVLGSNISLDIQTANSTQPGLLSAADYAKFNSKQDTLTQGSLNTTTTGVSIGGSGKVLGSNISLDIQTANSTQPGLLSATDFAKFNSKQDTLTQGSLNTTTTGVSISGSGKVLGSNISLDIQTANSTQPGLLSAADYAKFNSKQDTLTQGALNTTTTGVTIGGSGKVLGSNISLDIQTANSTQPGLLSAADFAKFNNKQDTIIQGSLNTTTTGVTIGGSGKVLGSNISIDIDTAMSGKTGLLSGSDWDKFNSKLGAFTSQASNLIFASPDAISGVPTFRSLTDSDIPDTITASKYLPLSGGSLSGNLTINNSAEIRLQDISGFYYTTFKAQTQSANVNYTLPASLPAGNAVMHSDASGNLTWQAPLTLPSGINKQTLRFNGTSLDSSSALVNDGNNIAIGFDPSNAINARLEVVKPASGNIFEISSSSTLHGDLLSVLNDGKTGFNVASPKTQVDINGGLTLRPSDTTATNGIKITPKNRTYMRISSSTLAANCVITLEDGLQAGQLLILQSVSGDDNGIQLNDGALDNLKLSGPITLDKYSTITLIWDGSYWVETARSNNP